MKLLYLFLSISILTSVSACDQRSEGELAEAEATVTLQNRASDIVGMPNLTSFAQKERASRIFELLDRDVLTYTYTYAEASGVLTRLCESVGYGVPFSSQYSSPTKLVRIRGERYQVPQPEPNGLYPPPTSDATWVTCLIEGTEHVVYVEPKIIVTDFPLDE